MSYGIVHLGQVSPIFLHMLIIKVKDLNAILTNPSF